MATGKDLNNTENLDQKEEHACTSDDKERKFRSDNLSNSVSRDENETHDGNRTADSAAVDCDKKSHDARPIDGKGTTESKSGGKDSKQKQKQSRKKKEEYTITFFYLQNVDSARDLLMTSIPAGMKIIFEERIENESEHSYAEFSKTYRVKILSEEQMKGRQFESFLYNLWLSKRPENEISCYIDIRNKDTRQNDSRKSVSTIQDVKFYGGALLSPVKFSKHYEAFRTMTARKTEAVFENDKGVLTIQSVVHGKENQEAVEISYNSMHDTIVVYPDNQSTILIVNVKSNPKIFNRKKINENRTDEVRNVSISGTTREEFGRSNSFYITWPSNIFDDLKNKSKIPVGWEVISRFKRLGFNVVYADVTVISYLPRAMTFSFEDFDMEYAWNCLCSHGFKVTDHLNEENVSFLRRSMEKFTPDMLHRITAKTNDRPFIHFASLISKQIEKNEIIIKETDDMPPGYSMIRRMVLTPTKHVFYPKEPIVQNRIIRQYAEEYFIRIVFRDEDYEKVSAIAPNSLDSVIDAMKKFLRAGFRILTRHYEFLGCSNSQLREHGFWFFCPNDDTNAQMIRHNCGDISLERCVASYVSRFGLCFSASRDTVNVGMQDGELVLQNDIRWNDYCFSDGIGKISPCLANKVTKALGYKVKPSAFQIRYGGCKGVVSQDPALGEEKDVLVIRESMNKFNSESKKLEILQVTQPGRLHLNRQAITLLSGLGVSDKVFLSLQEKMLFGLADTMVYDKEAVKVLSALSIHIRFKQLQKRGIVFVKEPFFRSMLITIYKCKIRDLMRRARIQLSWKKGRIMMGTLDDTGTLEYGQVFVQYSKIPGKEQEDTIVLEGPVVATKNPCFHPGDLRKYDAVDVPALHHMFDCIVFPQKGKRPHPNEMSGSDLDGDMYFVSWDDQFYNVIENQEPMDFPKATKKYLDRNVNVFDIIDFVGEYIKNDNLGIIANAHVVHADKKDIFTEACKLLAKMHSDAVDFPKTGQPAKMLKELKVDSYPDFMQKADKTQYASKKVLGKLFKQCRALEQAQTRQKDYTTIIRSIVPDKDLFLIDWQKYEDDAVDARNTYNEKVRQLLLLYGIENETEAISGIIRRLNPQRGCLKNEKYEIEQIVKAKMSVICKRTRERFFQDFGGETNIDFDCCDSEILRKASAWYVVTYRRDFDNPEPLLSFPWVIADVIGLLKEDKSEKREQLPPQDLTEEDETDIDNLFEIGSSIVRRYFSTKNQRHETLQRLKLLGNTVFRILDPVKGASFFPIGLFMTGLMRDNENTLDIHISTNKNKYTGILKFVHNLFHRSKDFFPESGFNPRYRIFIKNTACFVRFLKDVNVLRRSIFFSTFVRENKEIAPVIMFLLDWGRRTSITSGARQIFDEITFSMVIIGCILSMKNLHKDLKCSLPETLQESATGLDLGEMIEIDNISRSNQKILAKIVMYFFREYRATLADNISEGMIKFISDPSQTKPKFNILKNPLSQSNTTALLNEMLCGYQEIAERNTIDNFFGDVDLVENHLVLNLPLDTWDCVLFAEAYTERRLSKETGAIVRIRRANFRETKGVILEAWGNSEQLWKVNKSLQDLGDKSSKFVTTYSRDKAFIEGAYVTIFEGSRSTDDMLIFKPYTGLIQEHHKHREAVHLPYLRGVVRNVESSIEHVDDNDPDCQIFQQIFLQQINVVRENYDDTYHGILRFVMTFGNVYIVDVDNLSMSIKNMQEKLHRKHFIERKEYHSINKKSRGRGGRRQRGESYTSLCNNLSVGSRGRRISSSFIPSECNPHRVKEFLEKFGFQEDGKENKYHVSLQTGEADFGKPHTGLCVLDRDMNFIEFRLADLKWLAGDVIRLKSDDESKIPLDVRCKLQSRRILDIETIRQMSDLKGILDESCHLMEKQGDILCVSPHFKDRVTFVREKQVNSYSYPCTDSSDEGSVWYDMKIDVATVKEYSGYNRITGTFSDIVCRTEVTMMPKFPDLNSSDEDLIKYARRTWNLALYLGSQFD